MSFSLVALCFQGELIFADFGGPVVVCDATQTMAFNKAVLNYMANEPLVERYAAFGTFTSWAS